MGSVRVLCLLRIYLGFLESETKEPPSRFAGTTTRVFPLG